MAWPDKSTGTFELFFFSFLFWFLGRPNTTSVCEARKSISL